MTAERRAELVGLFAEVLAADEHTIDLPDASRLVGGCARLHSVLSARDAVLAPALRRLEIQAAQTRPADEAPHGGGHDADSWPDDDAVDARPDPATVPPSPTDPAETGETRPGSAADPAAVVPRVSVREQRRRDLRARWLDMFHGFAAELQAGRISTDHADALAVACERLEPWIVADLHAMEASLLSTARTLGPEALTTELTNRVEGIRDDRGQTLHQHQLAESRAWLRLDRASGMYQFHASLDPIRGEALQSVIDQYVDRLRRDDANQRVPYEQLVLQALLDLVLHDIRIAPKVLAVVDEQSARTGVQHQFTVCENVDGARLPLDHVLAACAINANVTAAIIDRAGRPADLHTDDRCADEAQRLEMRGMQRDCVFPGCDTPYSRVRLHHVVYHRDGGPTTVANLVAVCNGHHHDIHDRGWRLSIDGERTVTITRPDGAHHATVPADRLDGWRARLDQEAPTVGLGPPGRQRATGPPDQIAPAVPRPRPAA